MTSVSPRIRTALSTYLVIGATDVTMGARSFLSTYFMSRHSRAVGVPWAEIEPGVRTVIGGLT